MAHTKMHDWDIGTDGAIPMTSTRCASLPVVRMSDADGEYFGWEKPNGDLVPGTRIVNSTAMQAVVDAEDATIQSAAADAVSRKATLDAITAKIDATTPLDDADLAVIADLAMGRPL